MWKRLYSLKNILKYNTADKKISLALGDKHKAQVVLKGMYQALN